MHSSTTCLSCSNYAIIKRVLLLLQEQCTDSIIKFSRISIIYIFIIIHTHTQYAVVIILALKCSFRFTHIFYFYHSLFLHAFPHLHWGLLFFCVNITLYCKYVRREFPVFITLKSLFCLYSLYML